MVSKEEMLIFICREINRHKKEVDRLEEELSKYLKRVPKPKLKRGKK